MLSSIASGALPRKLQIMAGVQLLTSLSEIVIQQQFFFFPE